MAFDAHKLSVRPGTLSLMDERQIETAWASGLFEGEGCISVRTHHSGRYASVRLALGMCDKDVVDRFVRWAGCGSVLVRKPESAAHREFYMWQVAGRATGPLIEQMLPFFGERRSVKALEALHVVAGIGTPNGEKTHCAKGHEYTPENTWRRKSGARARRACWAISNDKRRAARHARQS